MKLHSYDGLRQWIDYEDLKPIIGRIRALAQSPKGYEMWVRSKLGDILKLLDEEG